MGKWDLKSLIGGGAVAYNDRLLISDQSATDGSQDRNIEASALSIAVQKFVVTQASHGLTVGECVRHNGTAYVEANASTAANAEVIGLVVQVIDTSTFVLQQAGYTDTQSGLTAGEYYYLQDAGGLGTTEGTIGIPVLLATSTTAGWLVPIAAAGSSGSVSQVPFIIACSDETTNLTAGTAAVTFRMPFAGTLDSVKADVNTAPTGSGITVDINETGTSVLSTKLTIDATEETSATAATAAVISDSALANNAEMTIDVDAVGSTTPGKGLKVTLMVTPS